MSLSSSNRISRADCEGANVCDNVNNKNNANNTNHILNNNRNEIMNEENEI